MSIILIPVLILIVFILSIIFIYNGLVTKVNRTKESWSDIDIQLKRRYDLIPNLINTVKGAANFESSTLEKVIQARNSAITIHDTGDKAKIAESENVLTGALKSVFALTESYPDLTATDNFKQLQMELSDTENKIQAARRFYNSNVNDLNTALQSFPSNIIAKYFSFQSMELFTLGENEAAAREPVVVNFN